MNNGTYDRLPFVRKARQAKREASQRIMRRLRHQVRQRLFSARLEDLRREQEEDSSGRQS